MLEEGDIVALVPPQTDLPRRVTVNFTRELGSDSYEVGFDEITDEAAAHGLAGCHCLIRRSDIDDALYAEEPAMWTGWCVVEGGGEPIGEVSAVVENPGQALLEVARPDAKPAYIPLVDDFIVNVDVDARTIIVDLPSGLLDL